jgi:hypothetical protein
VPDAVTGDFLVKPVPRHAYVSSIGGHISGSAGELLRLVLRPQAYFLVRKIMATDTSESPGRGTRVMRVFVSNNLQRPVPSTGTLTLFFTPGALDNGVWWDLCTPLSRLTIEVFFYATCTFDLALTGYMWDIW